MEDSGPSAAILRFWAGTLGGILAGYLAFGIQVFRPGGSPFQSVTVGALMAAILALVRSRRSTEGLAVVIAFALLQLGANWNAGWPRFLIATISSLFIAAGIFLIAVVFDHLARHGIRFFKFLVAGPLLGGIYLAVTPLSGWGALTGENALRNLLGNAWLGIVIGDGVGLGVELLELLAPGLYSRGAQEPAVSQPSAADVDADAEGGEWR